MSAQDQTAGKIVTFYSYKGGVGRSMAVANIGRVLKRHYARPDRETLLIDWDLQEGPTPPLAKVPCDIRRDGNSDRRYAGHLRMGAEGLFRSGRNVLWITKEFEVGGKQRLLRVGKLHHGPGSAVPCQQHVGLSFLPCLKRPETSMQVHGEFARRIAFEGLVN